MTTKQTKEWIAGMTPENFGPAEIQSLVGVADYVMQHLAGISPEAVRIIAQEKVAESLGDMLATQSFALTSAT